MSWPNRCGLKANTGFRFFISLSAFLWGFVDGLPSQNRWKTHDQVTTSTLESDAMSKELKRKGFKFVGTTVCYAFMQAVGMVNDHVTSCFRHSECRKLIPKP